MRYPNVSAITNTAIQLQARDFPAANYTWLPSFGLSSANIVNPVFKYDRQQEYRINIVTDAGCNITDTLLVNIFKESEIILPRGFSPNADGKNDKLKPILVAIRELKYFKVYDRWGQLVYQSNQANEGWDGNYKGIKQPMDTYTWMAEGVDMDGNTVRKTGATILLR